MMMVSFGLGERGSQVSASSPLQTGVGALGGAAARAGASGGWGAIATGAALVVTVSAGKSGVGSGSSCGGELKRTSRGDKSVPAISVGRAVAIRAGVAVRTSGVPILGVATAATPRLADWTGTGLMIGALTGERLSGGRKSGMQASPTRFSKIHAPSAVARLFKRPVPIWTDRASYSPAEGSAPAPFCNAWAGKRPRASSYFGGRMGSSATVATAYPISMRTLAQAPFATVSEEPQRLVSQLREGIDLKRGQSTSRSSFGRDPVKKLANRWRHGSAQATLR